MKFELPLIDFHCDTLYEMVKKNCGIVQNELAISLEHASVYSNYTQFFASWCSSRLTDDEGYDAFCRMADYLRNELSKPEVSARIQAVYTADDMENAWQNGRAAAILAVEDARILGNDITRLDHLASLGVRYLTLQWGGLTCIGGAFDTEEGLTDFGKQVVARCFDLGIVPDISHTNAHSAQDTIDIALAHGMPVIASHSNAYAVYDHPRNLRDEHFCALRDLGGIVGLNFYRSHLCDTDQRDATVSDLVRHVEHYLSLGGEHTVAIGGDWDGARLPAGFSHISDAHLLAEELDRLGYSEDLIRQLFYGNAQAFIKKNFH